MSQLTLNFYGVDASYEDFTPGVYLLINLLRKVYTNQERSWVVCANSDEVKKLDKDLWTKAAWLPHATDQDPHPESQPILISTSGENNLNQASTLFYVVSAEFQLNVVQAITKVQTIQKVCILFPVNSVAGCNFFEQTWQALSATHYIKKYFKQDHHGKFQTVQL